MINVFTGLSNKTLNQLNVTNMKLKSEIANTSLPLVFLDNIAKQNVDTEEKKTIFTKTFSDSLDKSIDYIEVTDSSLDDITGHLNSLESAWLHKNKIELLNLNVMKLLELNKQLEVVIMEIISDDQLNNYEKLGYANNVHQSIVEEFQRYQLLYLDTSLKIRNSQLLIINILAGLLVVVIVAMLLLLSRFLNNNVKVIKNFCAQIKSHEFDTTNIWRSRPYLDEEIEIHKVIDKYFEEEKWTSKFNSLVSKEYVVDNILDHLLDQTNEIMGVDRVGISFYDDSEEALVAEYSVAVYDRQYLNVGYKSIITNSSLISVIREKRGYINNDLLAIVRSNPESESLKLLIKEGIRSNMSIPLIMNNEVFGIVFLSSTKSHQFTEEHYSLATRLIYEITGALNRSYLMKVVMNRITIAFARLVDQKDIETGDHLIRMVKYSTAVAESLKEMAITSHPIDYKLINEIENNAATHDIGKVGTPDHILKKPGRLSEEEFKVMREHTMVGAEIFGELNHELSGFSDSFFSTAEKITRYHHEKWDGSGYPYGLIGFEIPLEARVVAIADVFDALTSKRTYKEAFGYEESLAIINESSGTHFDPVVVQAFLKGLTKIRKIYLSTNIEDC